jgi:regulator of replication initiation timing
MIFEPKAELILSLFGALGTAASWALKMKISHEISQNNVRINRKIEELKSSLSAQIAENKTEFVKELTNVKDRLLERSEAGDHSIGELKASLPDRVITIVNGKYVRRDLYRQGMDSVNSHFEGIQRLIETNLNNIENSMNRQISDLKERIFSSSPFRKSE